MVVHKVANNNHRRVHHRRVCSETLPRTNWVCAEPILFSHRNHNKQLMFPHMPSLRLLCLEYTKAVQSRGRWPTEARVPPDSEPDDLAGKVKPTKAVCCVVSVDPPACSVGWAQRSAKKKIRLPVTTPLSTYPTLNCDNLVRCLVSTEPSLLWSSLHCRWA